MGLKLQRRRLLLALPGASLGLGATLLGCRARSQQKQIAPQAEPVQAAPEPAAAALLESIELGQPPWKTFDPFLFCVHHNDAYPRGNAHMGPDASLEGRQLGQDFEGRDGWSMYHGTQVPGFPRHPHRGFETVTITRRGHIDHSDSLGATARYGEGDVQWMTAGRGIAHAEMFPLIDQEAPNPAELFQIWINLPAASKLVEPHFAMFWSASVARAETRDASGRKAEVVYIAGAPPALASPKPPPNSWAARPETSVAIWTIKLEPGATWTLPAAEPGLGRTLYYFAGDSLRVAGQQFRPSRALRLRSEVPAQLVNGPVASELLLLQGRPIGEPVVKHGPFVMNDREQIRQAIADYRKDGFGGWPWSDDAPVHARDKGRFALHADGRQERG